MEINKIESDLNKLIEGAVVSVDVNPQNFTMTITVTSPNVTERKKWEIHRDVQSYCYENLDDYASPIDLVILDSDTNEEVETFETIRSELKTWDRGYSEDELRGFSVIQWPEVQSYMDKPGFSHVARLVNDDEGLDLYGSSAYVIPNRMLNNWLIWK